MTCTKLGLRFGERLASRLLASPQCALQKALKNTAQQRASFPTPHNPSTTPTYSPTLSPPTLPLPLLSSYARRNKPQLTFPLLSSDAPPLRAPAQLSPSFGRCLSLMTRASNRPPPPPPVMPADELAQRLVFSFPSDKSHRAAIFHGFLYAFIAVVCYGSSSTRARAATIMQPARWRVCLCRYLGSWLHEASAGHTTVINHRSVRACQANVSQSV